ncbi:shikimate dehydrogenase family protein [Streptomyces sp. NPDC056144]|uniref:shikimate dehydrogenase family protein n=1 Tax=unclassified Streptomyces TaxID=2593676 RepID=UPI0035E18D37
MKTAPEGPQITGTTRLFAVLGDPVAQVQAPAMLNPLFARLGTDAVLVPVHATPERLADVVRGLQAIGNLDGLLITVPHKTALLGFADVVSPAARLGGSTNALRRLDDGRWEAANFDGEGFVRGLRAAGHDPAGRRVSLAGAGGAGCSIAVALLDAGADLTVWDRDADRVRALVDRLAERWPDRVAGAGAPVPADIAVNATPMGLRPEDPLPFDPADLDPGTVVADIVMKPRRTALLAAAEERGLPVQYGAPMLAEQLALYRDFFRL